jgi:hypothetical protein
VFTIAKPVLIPSFIWMKCRRVRRMTALLFLVFLLVDIRYGGLPCCDDCIQILPAGTSIAVPDETHDSETLGEKCLCCSSITLIDSLCFAPRRLFDGRQGEAHQVSSGLPKDLYHLPFSCSTNRPGFA